MFPLSLVYWWEGINYENEARACVGSANDSQHELAVYEHLSVHRWPRTHSFYHLLLLIDSCPLLRIYLLTYLITYLLNYSH